MYIFAHTSECDHFISLFFHCKIRFIIIFLKDYSEIKILNIFKVTRAYLDMKIMTHNLLLIVQNLNGHNLYSL